jgi:PHD/YefM family antitoxin component YafN of YafNO toxin-antitoxin module
VQYLTNENGERTAVVVPIAEYEELLEDLHLTRIARETADEPTRPLIEFVKELRTEGEIDV